MCLKNIACRGSLQLLHSNVVATDAKQGIARFLTPAPRVSVTVQATAVVITRANENKCILFRCPNRIGTGSIVAVAELPGQAQACEDELMEANNT